MEYVDLGISFVGGVASTLALGYAYWRHRKELRMERREDRFRAHIQPMLCEVRNGLGTELSPEQKRFLVKEVVRAASQAAFNRDRPPSPGSEELGNETLNCDFCELTVETDSRGACGYCGLGPGHWLSLEERYGA